MQFPNNKLILTTGGRRNRANDRWDSTGPTDSQLEELYKELQGHINSSLLKKMYSIEINTVGEALNTLQEVLDRETEVFMDVQDI